MLLGTLDPLEGLLLLLTGSALVMLGYDELGKLAAAKLAHEAPGHTMRRWTNLRCWTSARRNW